MTAQPAVAEAWHSTALSACLDVGRPQPLQVVVKADDLPARSDHHQHLHTQAVT